MTLSGIAAFSGAPKVVMQLSTCFVFNVLWCFVK